MELKEFVSEALGQIMEGVKSAQSKASELSGKINPDGFSNADTSALRGRNGEIAQIIFFDIVVSTTDADRAKGGVGIFVGDVGIGVRGEAETQSMATNKIRFSIPVYLPTQK